MKNIFALILLAATIFTACRPEPIKIKIDPLEPEVVVFSQLIPDRIMTVVLTKSFGALEFSEDNGQQVDSNLIDRLLVEKANVRISFKGSTYQLDEVAPGVYASVEILQYPYETYKLDISTKSGKKLTSTTTMLPKIHFDSITPVIERNVTDTLVTVKYKFTDFPEKNWYMINFYKQTPIDSTGLNLNNYFGSGASSLNYTYLIDDAILKNGQTIEGVIELKEFLPTDSMAVSFANISEKYFNYLEGRKKAGTLFTELTKEPIHSPTNIEGGRGFFNTHFPSIRSYDLNNY